jgi:hypothetical protein
MYAMCAGRPPFRAESTVAVLKRICEEEPTALAQLNAEVPPWLSRIIARLHAKAPHDRFASAAEVAELLQRCLAHVQNPATVPLPAELASSPRGWKEKWLTGPRLIVAGVLLAASVIVAMLAQSFRDGASGDEPNGKAKTSQRTNSDPPADKSAGENPGEAIADGKPRNVPITDADYAMLEQSFQRGEIDDPETLYQWSLRVLHSEAAQEQSSQGDMALRRHLQRMQRLEQLATVRDSPLDKVATTFYRLEAESMLAQRRARH